MAAGYPAQSGGASGARTTGPPTVETRRLAAVVGASLLLRVGHLAWIRSVEMPLLFDETGYFDRARGFAAILRAWLGTPAGAEAFDSAYGGGTWPPFHSLLLGVAMAIGGGGELAPRLLMVLVSTATTAVVYLAARPLVGGGAAIAAAALHAAHPSFVAFSGLLWSETTYVLVLIAILALVADRETALATPGAVCLGLLCGLLVLTRVVGLAVVPVVLLALLAGRPRGRRWRAAALVLLLAILVVLPWQRTVMRREGAPVLLSSASGINLLIANHPWRGERDAERLPFLDHQARQLAAKEGIHPDTAARRLAGAWIREHPGDFLRSSLLQLRRLWTFDLFTARHLLIAAYPALPVVLAEAALAGLVAAFVATLALAGGGAVALARESPARLGLLLALFVAAQLPSWVAVSNPRLAMPALALLLPLAGRGAIALRAPGARRRALAGVLAVGGLAAANVATLRESSRPVAERSSVYRQLAPAWLTLLGWPATTFDAIELASTEAGTVAARPIGGYAEVGGGARRTGSGAERLELRGVRPVAPLALELETARSAPIRVEPVDRRALRVWREPAPGLRLRWLGGVRARGVERGLEPYAPRGGSEP